MSIFVDDVEVTFGAYPNGEATVPKLSSRLTDASVEHLVRLHWEDDRDLVRLALIRGLLGGGRLPRLFVDYMPYSRMDRAQDGFCFSLKHVADVLNSLNWREVHVVEPHSAATLQLVDSSVPVWATPALTRKLRELGAFDSVVLPDDGAVTRYEKLMPDVLAGCNVVVMSKTRDFATGKITGLEVAHRVMRGASTTVGRALIVDDLCSRGGTFVRAAELLRDLGAESVALLVAHMEPAGLVGDLPTKLDRVFCTDTMTFPRPVPANFTVLPRSDWL